MIDPQVIAAVARRLEALDATPVFVGGAVVAAYLDAFGRAQQRPTLDVDCIVAGTSTAAAWWSLEQRLRGAGWSPDPTGPICRYHSPDGTPVDLMPEDPGVLGFAGRWYPCAVRSARLVELQEGV